MKRLVLVFVALVLAATVRAETYPLAEQSPAAWATIALQAIRGWRFQCNAANVTVTQLGCYYPDSTTATKTLTLHNFNTQALLAQAVPTTGSGWRWVNLATPVTLQQGQQYIVAGHSMTGHYFNNSIPVTWAPTGTIQYIDMRYMNSPTSPTQFPTGVIANSHHGVVDFGYTIGPKLTVGTAPAGAQSVYTHETGPGDNGIAAATFIVDANAEPGAELIDVRIAATGTGNDQAAFAQVALYRDSNSSNAFEAGGDNLIGAAATSFPVDDGMLTFAVQAAEQAFGPNVSRRYFIVVKLAGTAMPGATLNFIVDDITVAGPGTQKAGVPSAPLSGLVILAPTFEFVDSSAAAPAQAQAGSQGNLCQEFTLAYPAGPDTRPATISVAALGTGHDAAHLSGVALWFDSDTSGALEFASDTLVDSSSFALDNGTLAFDLTGHPVFQAGQTRRYFVVYDFNLAGVHGQTFKCYMSAAAGAAFGAVYSGLPAPSLSGAPGLVLSDVRLAASLNGPGAAITVQNNSQGVGGAGELLSDITLAAGSGQGWPLDEITFAASGTASHDAAYSQIGLYEDTGNGIWDGPATDGAAAGTLAGFGPGPGFEATFQLSNGLVPAGQSRRFFLAGRLAGTATTGETLNARLISVGGAFPPGGVLQGFPTLDSSALIIGQSALTIAGAPGAPGDQIHQAGTAMAFVMAKFRLTTSNDSVTVSGITFTGTGSGNWATDMGAGNGIQVFRDNGDGVFDAGTDTLLYPGAGAASMNAMFTPSLDIPVRGNRDIWVRVNLLDTAGLGVATQTSFTVSVVQTSDVASNAQQTLIGTPPPNGAILNVVDFKVTSFDPLTDIPAGGKPITINGTGFLSPFSVTIEGKVCPGTATVTPTLVTGLQVPPGTGTGKTIIVTSGSLQPITLADTFEYVPLGGGSAPAASGCAAARGGMAILPMLLALKRRRSIISGRQRSKL